MATWEDASRCPKCAQPGKQVSRVRVQPGTRGGGFVHTLQCETSVCKWFEQRWIVQVRDDGTVPDPETRRGPKAFTELTRADKAFARAQLEQLKIEEERGTGPR